MQIVTLAVLLKTLKVIHKVEISDQSLTNHFFWNDLAFILHFLMNRINKSILVEQNETKSMLKWVLLFSCLEKSIHIYRSTESTREVRETRICN